MIERVLAFSVRRRWFVLLATLLAAVAGLWSLTRLPIDAVPDITNNQVQINSICAGAVADRYREAGDVPGRNRARRDPRPRIHTLDLPQRFFPGDGGLQGSHQHLFRAPAGRRAPDRGAALAAARCRPADGADFNRSQRNLHVDGRLFPHRTGQPRAGTVSRVLATDGTPEGQRLRERLRTCRLSAHRSGLDHPAAAGGTCRTSPAWTQSADT